jgi:hypothetical protein
MIADSPAGASGECGLPAPCPPTWAAKNLRLHPWQVHPCLRGKGESLKSGGWHNPIVAVENLLSLARFDVALLCSYQQILVLSEKREPRMDADERGLLLRLLRLSNLQKRISA